MIFDFYANTDKKDKQAFNDALPIGNGSMGAMIYGGIQEEKIILNEDSLWLGKRNRKRENPDFKNYYPKIKEFMRNGAFLEAEQLLKLSAFSAPKGECIYSAAGEVRLEFESSEYANYQRKLDLDKGLVIVEYDQDDNHIKRTYLANYPSQVMAFRIESKLPISFTGSLDRDKLVDQIKQVSSNELELIYQYATRQTLCIRLKVVTDGEFQIIGNHFCIQNSLQTDIFITLRTTFYTKNVRHWCQKRLKHCNYDQLISEHLLDYQALYQKQTFQTNDDKMNYIYNFSRYLMISCSRKHTQPANLQGIWNQDIFPAWDSKYTININLEMNYWNVFRANLVSCSEPLFDLLKRVYHQGKRLAKTMYQTKGFVAFHNADLYGDCAPQDAYLPATYWPLGGAWLALFIYKYYLYTKDRCFLKRNYAILFDSALFFRNILEKNEHQEYIISPSLSPENSYLYKGKVLHLCNGCTMDREILFDLFSCMIEVNKILNIHLKDNSIYQDILSHLPKIKISKNQTIREWNEDYEEVELGHRHISQLYGLYPSFQITSKDPELFSAAKNTIARRLANGGGHTGWSKAWLTAMYARLGEGDQAYQSFQEFIQNSTSRVGLDLHPPFQIDGNFGIAAAISEMLILEQHNHLTLLPALPSSGLESGQYGGILLHHQVELSIKWNHNCLIYLEFVNLGTDSVTYYLHCEKRAISIPEKIELKAHQKVILK